MFEEILFRIGLERTFLSIVFVISTKEKSHELFRKVSQLIF